MDMVMSVCDHVIVFDRGRPIAAGPGAPTITDAATGQDYEDAGSAKDDLIAAILEGDADELGALARTWNDAYNIDESDGDRTPKGVYSVQSRVENETMDSASRSLPELRISAYSFKLRPIRTARSRATSGYTTGSQHGSPAGRLVFGASSRSTAIYIRISIELITVNA